MKIQPSQISVSGFRDAFSKGMSEIETAAKILAELVDRDGPKIYQEILKLEPRATLNQLEVLESVGRGVTPIEQLFDSSHAASHIRRLPIGQKKEAYAKPLRVLQIEKGKKVVVEKQARELTPLECQIVFAGNRINEPNEQAKILQLKQGGRAKPAERFKWNEDGSMDVLANTRFTAAQLEKFAQQAKQMAINSLRAA